MVPMNNDNIAEQTKLYSIKNVTKFQIFVQFEDITNAYQNIT